MLAKVASRNLWLRTLAVAVCGAFTVLAVAATTPKPPAVICIGSNCATGPVVSGDIKWHPGHYVWVSGPGFPSKVQSATYGLLNATAKDTALAGIQIIFKWGDLEGDKAGDYSGGFAMIDALLGKLGSLPTPKRLMISVQERSFGAGSGNVPDGMYPQYIVDMGGAVLVAPKGSTWSGSLNSIANLVNPAVMDRLIALSQAYGKRYNSNPLVEMYVPMSELAVSANAGFHAATYIQQVERLYAASAQAWPNTLLRWQLNYAPADPNDSNMLGLLAFAQTLPQSVIGGPDPEVPLPLTSSYPTGVRTVQGNKVFRGMRSGSTVAEVYADLRGKLPWVGEYQGGPGIGAGSVLPGDFGNYEINVMHASYVIYICNTWLPANTASTDPHKWGSQLAYIDSTRGQTFGGMSAPQ